MARHTATRFIHKIHAVEEAVRAVRQGDLRPSETGFVYGPEVVPGVRLVTLSAGGRQAIFTLWEYERDVVEFCGDSAYPATSGALVIRGDDAQRLADRGVLIDLSQFVRSESYPGYYYVLFDHLSPLQVRRTLERLVPTFARRETLAA